MFNRARVEDEYFPIYRHPYNIGTTIFSPLAGGFLTGKYIDGIPEGSRATQPGFQGLKRRARNNAQQVNKLKALSEYAESNLGCNMAQLAIAWCIKNPNVSTVLLGATKVEQIEDNLKAIQVAHKLTARNMDDIEQILANQPGPYWNERKPEPTI
jgi:aryl-alcohol dehydrogenase-like predicted oxidoreductase